MATPDLYAGFLEERTSGEGVIIAGIKASGDVNFQNNKGLNVITPTASGDAANKKYVDDNAGISVWTQDFADGEGGLLISGDAINIAPSGNAVVRADAMNDRACDGFCESTDGVTATCILLDGRKISGVNTEGSGDIVAGSRVFQSGSPGKVTKTPPHASGDLIQRTMKATSAEVNGKIDAIIQIQEAETVWAK